MSRRLSDAEKVLEFFQRADEPAIAVMFDAIKFVMNGRQFDEKPVPKVKKVTKPKLVPPAVSNAVEGMSLAETLKASLAQSTG